MKDLAGIDLPKYFGNLNVEPVPEAAKKGTDDAEVVEVHKSAPLSETQPHVGPTRPAATATSIGTTPPIGKVHKRSYGSFTHLV